jgi:hypothetical protein
MRIICVLSGATCLTTEDTTVKKSKCMKSLILQFMLFLPVDKESGVSDPMEIDMLLPGVPPFCGGVATLAKISFV